MKYEYTVLQFDVTDNDETNKFLLDYGEKGWKLVSVVPLTSGGTIFHLRFYFIREVNSEMQ